jgi:uncharacterized membrane protein
VAARRHWQAAGQLLHGKIPVIRGVKSRQIFFRGLAIILPTVLTIWILIAAYQFVQTRIARPINNGIQALVVQLSHWPTARDVDLDEAVDSLTVVQKDQWQLIDSEQKKQLGDGYSAAMQIKTRRQWMRNQPEIEATARHLALVQWWQSVRIGTWAVLDLIGLAVAIVLIYIVGVILSGYIGRRLYHRGEQVIGRVPLIRRVYPSVKQVTDFFFSGEQAGGSAFNRVVAVEYPRRGIWSVGLVTGQTMRNIQAKIGQESLTVFIPSSPTPVTGYVITVPECDTIDLSVTIEEALKFAVSLGVLVPPSQEISIKPRPDGGPDVLTPSQPAPEAPTDP